MSNNYTYPGIYIEEEVSGPRTISGVATSIAVFIGTAYNASSTDKDPKHIFSYSDYVNKYYGGDSKKLFEAGFKDFDLNIAVRFFFLNGGGECYVINVGPLTTPTTTTTTTTTTTPASTTTTTTTTPASTTTTTTTTTPIPTSKPLPTDYTDAIKKLKSIDLFNLLIITKYRGMSDSMYKNILTEAAKVCQERRAILLVDPFDWGAKPFDDIIKDSNLNGLNPKENCAIYYPNLKIDEFDPKTTKYEQRVMGPAAVIAGIISRIDSQRGVWKAPAGIEAYITGISGLELDLTNEENGILNVEGINCLRRFNGGPVCWGARTLQCLGDDAPPWKYLPVRRLALYIEETLYRNTNWVVFEPNDEPLWGLIRASIKGFMFDLYNKGAFQGSLDKAFFVKCDNETTTPDNQEQGILNIIVGFAPVKPAEYVIITIQRIMGQQK